MKLGQTLNVVASGVGVGKSIFWSERMKLEMFIDHAYYDMWCVKPVGMRDFNATLHFNSEKEAGYAMQTIEKWFNMEFARNEIITSCSSDDPDEQCEGCNCWKKTREMCS
jgi:hypothetical protein